MKKGKIRVDVRPGLFSMERIASFRVGDRSYSLLVDEEDVRDSTLTVYVLDEVDGHALIHLPGETMNAGSRVVVPRGDLLPAPA